MPCIVSRAFILLYIVFTNAKDKRFTSNFFVILLSKVHKDRENLHVFELKRLIYVKQNQVLFPSLPAMLLIIGNCRKVRGLGKRMVVFCLFEKLGYSCFMKDHDN